MPTFREREYGEVVLYNMWATVLGIFATLSLSSGVYQAALIELANDLDAYISSMIGLSSVSVLLCFAIVFSVIRSSADFTGLGSCLLFFVFTWFLFNSAPLLWQVRERFAYQSG